jgi:hypothetical protein
VAATNWLRRATVGGLVVAGLLAQSECVSVDPGKDFVVPDIVFDQNYFYCHVEPGLIFTYSCGTGDSSKGDPPNGCHFNASAVSGMALLNHPPVNCGGGDEPVDPTQTGPGSPAASNFEAVSIEMNQDYTSAALYARPSNLSGCPPTAHPRCVFNVVGNNVNQDVITLLSTWATK